jgi:hypothetical protein
MKKLGTIFIPIHILKSNGLMTLPAISALIPKRRLKKLSSLILRATP